MLRAQCSVVCTQCLWSSIQNSGMHLILLLNVFVLLDFLRPAPINSLMTATIKEVEGVPTAEEMIRYLVNAQEATARTARELFLS